MKKIVILCSFVFLASCCHFSTPNKPAPNNKYPAVFLISMHDFNCFGLPNVAAMEMCVTSGVTGKGSPLSGTGFWISDHLFVTAKHLAVFAKYDPEAHLVMSINDEYHKKVKVNSWTVAENPLYEIDLAIGYVQDAPRHTVLRPCFDVFAGEPGTAYGYPIDLKSKTLRLEVVAVEGVQLMIYGRLRPGFSGGPIMSNARQCVLGVSSKMSRLAPEYSFGVSAETLLDFIDVYNAASRVPKESR